MVYITTQDPNYVDILPTTNVPTGQAEASKASTTVEYMSRLQILSKADKIRLSGIVCTIGPVSKAPEFLMKMIESGMNIARMNREEKGFDPSLAIALDTKGPEIRTGLLEGDDGRKELIFEAGDTLKLTTDDAFKEKCTKEVVWLDYKNITKVLVPGKRIYIDDGLISVKALEIGPDYVLGEVENG